jgi:hypothetical protein
VVRDCIPSLPSDPSFLIITSAPREKEGWHRNKTFKARQRQGGGQKEAKQRLTTAEICLGIPSGALSRLGHAHTPRLPGRWRWRWLAENIRGQMSPCPTLKPTHPILSASIIPLSSASPTATAAVAEEREKEKERGVRVGAANLPRRTREGGERKKKTTSLFSSGTPLQRRNQRRLLIDSQTVGTAR